MCGICCCTGTNTADSGVSFTLQLTGGMVGTTSLAAEALSLHWNSGKSEAIVLWHSCALVTVLHILWLLESRSVASWTGRHKVIVWCEGRIITWTWNTLEANVGCKRLECK